MYGREIGNEKCVQSTFRDITERKRAEEALRESEERFRTVANFAYNWECWLGADGNYVYVSPSCERITGYRADEFLSNPRLLEEIVHPDDREILAGHSSQELDRDGVYAIDFRIIARSGEERWIGHVCQPVCGADGSWLGRRASNRDITERKRAEEALRESEENLQKAQAITHIGSWSWDFATNKVEWSDEMYRIFGFSSETFNGTVEEVIEAVHPDDRDEFLRANKKVLTTHETEPLEYRIVLPDGAVRVVWAEGEFVCNSNGEIIGQVGTVQDITERKRAQEALQRRNYELAMLNRASQALISTLDLDQIIITVLEKVRQLLDVVAGSIWLSDPETGGLVCHQSAGPQNEVMRGWRLAPGQGLVGWVARSGEGLIVPDARADERYFEGVDQQTGLALRSILSVPLRVKNGVIGVLQVVDTEVGRFSTTDLELLEPLAMAAAMAIENARLYGQARRDAETRSMLLREVNHRVKNNLSAIIGLLHTEQRHVEASTREVEEQAIYQSIMQDLISRVQSLATVHGLLSTSEWEPVPLSELTAQVIRSALQTLPRDKRVSVDATPSPVRVTSDQAHHLALVINELATNTIKHGLQERDTARIAVRIGLEEDAAGRTVLLEFRDDGPGYPDEVLRLERYSVGFDLIRNIVRKNLRGELSLHNDRGAVATVRFKAEAEVN